MSKIKTIQNADDITPLKLTSKLEDFIVIIKDALSSEECDNIVNYYSKCDEWSVATVGYGDVNTNIRSVDQLSISLESSILKDPDKRKKIDELVFSGVSKCIHSYHKMFPWCNIEIDTGYILLRYNEGCFYKEHTDSFLKEQRTISCSIALNDDFKGGKFSFFNDTLSAKVAKGDAILFPSSFQYPHQITTVKQGTRYSIITWLV